MFFCVNPLFCYAVLCVLSSFAITSLGKRELVVFLFVFLMSCGCYHSLLLPRDAVGWSAVCDCGISLSYSLTFL